ncbi:GNAT family N-acetyltransferase [Croceimicrobium hydrocarbonivorans]|uniref:N-acetyltransferase n=1 Tax=Croceimicrobium hydrocarbonivorans TaxID=2761580 RepID=A0A7H0VFT1_9FLAO|nr:GNAT family N-acetyltransferase [Croceimicrobium hydrocarbonivorans]QNR24579.1 N-acetyltransferase [Croceimicrobium hydrocarbonivorans]
MDLRAVKCEVLQEAHIGDLMQIWNSEYPRQIAYSSLSEIQEYLNKLKEPRHQILVDKENRLKAWFCVFERDALPWFAMILDRDLQGLGYGRKLLSEAQFEESILNGWAVDHPHYQRADGSTYPSPIGFYLKLGFKLTGKRFDENGLSLAHILWP